MSIPSIKYTSPEIAKDWDYEKNLGQLIYFLERFILTVNKCIDVDFDPEDSGSCKTLSDFPGQVMPQVQQTKQVLEFALTFERVLPTVSLTIDAVAVPMLKFQISSGAELSTSTKINSDVSKSVFLGTGYQLTIALDLSDTTNTKTEELLSYVLNQTFETPHSIILTKGALTAEYDVLLNNGSYSFEDNPVDRIDLVFVEVDSE